MARKKPAKKRAKKVAKKRSAARRPKRAAKPRRKAAKPRRKAAARPRRKAAPRARRAPAAPKIRPGVITHTELASMDPPATREWCTNVLGWKFGESVPTPTGPYHMWRFDNATGGGIRSNNPPEMPGSIPYCEVEDIRATFTQALAYGASEMLAPMELPGGMGWIAIVAAPGGVAIGFWGMK
jgi:predicted enzyme related to lactoylglutathione lyase